MHAGVLFFVESMHEKLKTAIKNVIRQDFEALVSENEKEVKARWEFEEGIKRPYFHNKPLGRFYG